MAAPIVGARDQDAGARQFCGHGEADLCSQQRYLPAAPMMAMPVMPTPAPVTVTPAPVTVTPAPMAMVPAPVMAMPPPHLLRLEPCDLLSRCHGWIGIRLIFN